MAEWNEECIPLILFDAHCQLANAADARLKICETPPTPDLLKKGCILNMEGEDGQAAAYLEKLRRNNYTRLIPVLLTQGKASDRTLALSDGVISFVDEAFRISRRINESLGDLSGECSENDELCLLAFLYSRQRRLEPVRNPYSGSFYQYPLAECFFTEGSDANAWVAQLQERGLLEAAQLVDRVRLCPRDHAAQINYVDVCPSCGGINIVRQPFLHCFACGHVGPQDLFISSAGLICPHCRERLRHIGTDYDRPLENYQCKSCLSAFSEPSVIARCVTCAGSYDPAELLVQNVSMLDLTAKARTVAHTGNLDDIYALLDEFGYLQPHYFEQHLQWMLHMVRRYPEEIFSVIGIWLKNVPELIEILGKQPVHELLGSFAGRLGELLRTTDLTTRTAVDELWMILPRTPAAGCEVIIGRITELGRQTRRPDGSGIEYAAFYHTEDGKRPDNEDAAFVMAQYATALRS